MTHHHSHDCSHHHHDHHHAPRYGWAFVLAIFLNAGFVIVEFAYGWLANSTALIADAGHNLSDVLGLVMAGGANLLAQKQPSKRYTYGLRSTTILAALANSMLLLVACGAIAWEAAQRFAMPPEVASLTVSSVAGIGIVINGVSALLFMKGSHHDINIRGAFLHMAGDALVSLAVVIVGVVMFYTPDTYWLDPAVTLVIVLVIVVGTWHILREALRLVLSAVPANIDSAAIEDYLCQLNGVTDCHDLHIWGLSTTETALTAHLVMPEGCDDGFLDEVVHTLQHEFAIHHATLQIEQGSQTHTCSLVKSTAHAH
ncbi:Cadmium, cobalt and zinc/H(+)-K(+) antiporter [Patescibacteria group bacterium]|nr:Cadmium, cobalt and zinc/H(+)-K(+) antiporter [Patescibacteria group bacterium]